MDENKLRFGVGVLVISAVGIGIILVFLFGAFPRVLNRDYMLTTVFPSAEGIGPNTPVFRDGVRIGRVSSIRLRDEGGVQVTLAMDSSMPLTHRYVPRIGTGNLVTGDSKLEFVRATEEQLAEYFPENPAAADEPYTDEEYFRYGTKSESLVEMQDDLRDTFEAIRSAGESIAAAGESVNQLANQVSDAIGGTDGKVDQLADQAVETLEEFQGAIRDVRAVIGNPELQQSLEQSLTQIPVLIQDAQGVLDTANESLETLGNAGEQFEQVGIVAEQALGGVQSTVESAQRTVQNFEQFSEPLAERGEELVDQAIRSLASVETSLNQLDTFGQAINNSDGTLRRLLEDDQLYFQIQRTVENIEQATARVRPILDDVRVFTDKIARDPRELGVRGAIGRRGSGLGLK